MDVAVVPVNEQLKKARKKASWSQERVAETLNLTVSVVARLENGEFNELPKGPFVTGYIRAYAGLFDLDADSLITVLHSEHSESAPLAPADFQEPEMHNTKLSAGFEHKKYRTAYGIAAAVGMLVLLALYSLLQVTPEAIGDTYEQHDAVMVKQALASLVSEPTDIGASNTSDYTPSATVNTPQLLPAAASVAVLPVKVHSSVEGILAMRFSGDCWVEVKDADGELIFASVKGADDVVQLEGDAPFHVTLGYAPAVMLSYNGKPVNIQSGRTNVARLVVGNT
ncbi:Cytoskeleton protein RodZ [BD1-7 clade bacterium]|uniref:Cytoskeleton protein RodZ n=1 Tax=BD1-7 clade bacterium TaxID=2029982 RepID=A0A5S9PA18_9GAMM|nr:Cytoskeleton protein RodZ [BD1-7 clade bacterium]CAA0116105.1 Cytoskeleton protein RodZ [BD1-7 clade bacterium]